MNMRKRIIELEQLVKEVSKVLKLSKFNITYITDIEQIQFHKEVLQENGYELAMNPECKGLASSGREVYIFLFRFKGLSANIDMRFAIVHELRHLWQFDNDFKFSHAWMPYEFKAEEVDANDYARAYLHKEIESFKFSLKVRAVKEFVIGAAIVTGASLLAGILLNKSKKNN